MCRNAHVSKLVGLSVEKFYMAVTEIQLQYVGFMAPVAKKVPDPWNTLSILQSGMIWTRQALFITVQH